MALVDYTALTKATGWSEAAPICAAEPVSGVDKTYWRKVRLDFALTNLAAADWIKFMVIPAHTYVNQIMVSVLTADAATTVLTFGDAATNDSLSWLATCSGAVANVVYPTLAADTNGATAGLYYHTAGALYMSSDGICDTLKIDVYVHCMNLDPA